MWEKIIKELGYWQQQSVFANKKGFTLVELLIAMSIFMIFTGIVLGSYSTIVQAQKQANEQRILYVEARTVFDELITALRASMIDYAAYDPETRTLSPDGILTGQDGATIHLISKDGGVKTEIRYQDEVVKIGRSERDNLTGAYQPLADENFEELNTEAVKITRFYAYASPVVDPYDLKNVYFDLNQFHPKVTIYAEFTKEMANGDPPIVMDLQTTISSRVYNSLAVE